MGRKRGRRPHTDGEREHPAGRPEEDMDGKLNEDCLFISAKNKENIDEFREILYKKVRELHVQKYPYNDFLYQDYE